MSTNSPQPTTPTEQPGGFFSTNNTAPFSPPPSSVSSSLANSTLPHPRARPLRLGSSKESGFINYVDRGILNVNRRFTKKFSGGEGGDGGVEKDGCGGKENGVGGGKDKEVKGYVSFREVGRDLEGLVDVVWVSGTRMSTLYTNNHSIGEVGKTCANYILLCSASLQIPYLLSLALITTNFLPAFPPVPRTMFRLLRKLDFAFASLLQGRDVDTGDSLPGFENGAGRVSTTEKVRMKGLVERTRVTVVEVMRDGEAEEEEEEEQETENEEMDDLDVNDWFEVQGMDRWEMEIARVYDRTLVELGETMAGEGGSGGL